MPWVAKNPDSGKLITPAKATDSKTYLCTNCAEGMFVRPHRETPSTTTRHFVHYSDTGCVGETDVHFHAKMMAESLLHEIFEDLHNKEVEIIDNELCFDKGKLKRQFADAGVRFRAELNPWGEGLAIEVQHKNKSKRKGESAVLYKEKNVSVLWLQPHHLLKMGDDAKNIFYKMIIGKHKRLKRNRAPSNQTMPTYPYIDFYNETNNPGQKQEESKESWKSSSGDYVSMGKRWKPRYKYTRYKSLTPKSEEWHCSKHGCTNHFVKTYRFRRDGMILKMQRCEDHGKPADSEITTGFGLLRMEKSG